MPRRLKVILHVCFLATSAAVLAFLAANVRPQFLSTLSMHSVTIAPLSVRAQGPTLLWSADMEPVSTLTGASTLDAWYLPNCCTGSDVSPPDSSENNNGGGLFNTGIASAGPSFDVNHTTGGKYSALLQIDTSRPDPTTGSSATRLCRWLEPQNYSDLYYSVWLYFPQVYTPSQYWAILEWKSKHSAGNDPFWVLNVSNSNGSIGPMSFYLRNAQTNTSYNQSLKNIPVGQWTNVQAHYICAGDNTGRVTIWQDGTEIFDLSGVQTRYSDGTCQWDTESESNGLTPNPATIYIDDATICTGGLSHEFQQQNEDYRRRAEDVFGCLYDGRIGGRWTSDKQE